jgi:pyroglutamyl-peptidase
MPRQAALSRRVLVTGFEPFGGYRINPSAELARRLDGARIGAVRVTGRLLPVDLARIDRVLDSLVKQVRPVAVVALGLAAGEAAIRLERFAVNLADFATPDNAGATAHSQILEEDGPAACATRLPLAAIRSALLRAGIPARQSNSAGTYLCNAAMYKLLRLLPEVVPCGFIHLPHAPAEAARLSAKTGGDPPPSMTLELQLQAVMLALRQTLAKHPARRK